MKKYGMWFTDQLAPEARKTAQKTVDGYRRTLNRLKANAAPSSVVETVGIPRVEAEIIVRENFIRCCDEYTAEKQREMAYLSENSHVPRPQKQQSCPRASWALRSSSPDLF